MAASGIDAVYVRVHTHVRLMRLGRLGKANITKHLGAEPHEGFG